MNATRGANATRRLTQRPHISLGLLVFVFVLAVAFVGPFVAPHSPDVPLGIPGTEPSGSSWLGTDALGRDVLSRVLHGGWTVVLLAASSVVVAYVIGGLLGLLAGYRRSWIDPLIMRLVDVLIAIPSILMVLLLLEGLTSGISAMILVSGLVQSPYIARLVRAATMEVSVAGYVEAATARGEGTWWLLRKEILPNIARPIVADFGIRASYAVLIVATINYLGLGLSPGTADWGLMVSQNQEIVSLNIWSLLAPAAMIALLTIGFNLLGDAALEGRRGAGSRSSMRRPQIAPLLDVASSPDSALPDALSENGHWESEGGTPGALAP